VYVFGGQAVQLRPLEEKVPTGQMEQESAMGLLGCVPQGQGSQSMAPELEENVPKGQTVQFRPLSEKNPG